MKAIFTESGKSSVRVWRRVCLPLLTGFLISLAEQFTAELSLEGWNETLLNGEVGAKESSTKFLSELGFRIASKFSMK